MAGLTNYNFKKMSSGQVAAPGIASTSINSYKRNPTYVSSITNTKPDSISISFTDLENISTREITNSLHYESVENH